jgi:hypothetical protein
MTGIDVARNAVAVRPEEGEGELTASLQDDPLPRRRSVHEKRKLEEMPLVKLGSPVVGLVMHDAEEARDAELGEPGLLLGFSKQPDAHIFARKQRSAGKLGAQRWSFPRAKEKDAAIARDVRDSLSNDAQSFAAYCGVSSGRLLFS